MFNSNLWLIFISPAIMMYCGGGTQDIKTHSMKHKKSDVHSAFIHHKKNIEH